MLRCNGYFTKSSPGNKGSEYTKHDIKSDLRPLATCNVKDASAEHQYNNAYRRDRCKPWLYAH